MIPDYFISKALDAFLKFCKVKYNDLKLPIRFDKKSIQESLQIHTNTIRIESTELGNNISNLKKPIASSYIDLKFHLNPRNNLAHGEEIMSERIDLDAYFTDLVQNTIILGEPGAGKTSTILYIANKIVTTARKEFANQYRFVILIRFRELSTYGSKTFRKKELIFDRVFRIFGLNDISIISNSRNIMENIAIKALNELNVLLILDGYDEYPYLDKRDLLDEIKTLGRSLTSSNFILTSRSTNFPYNISNSKRFEIARLDNPQIKSMAKKLLDSDLDGEDFYNQLLSKTYLETARRPLILSYLLKIYKAPLKRKTPSKPTLPTKPNEIYEKVVEILIRDWDEERGIDRETEFLGFNYSKKKKFLYTLSYTLTKRFYASSFSENAIRSIYIDLAEAFELPEEESYEVLKELESHSGLFVKTGENRYEFAHKVIQEYFTAEYLKGIADFTKEDIDFFRLPSELAVLVGISNGANDHFISIIDLILKSDINYEFINVWLSRIITEFPDFIANDYLAYKTFLLYEKIIEGDNVEDDEIISVKNTIEKFLSLPILKKSILKLNKYYKVEPNILKSLIEKQNNIDPNQFVEIVPADVFIKGLAMDRKYTTKIYTSILFLYKWQYIENLNFKVLT